MAIWLPAVKAILPYVTQIVAAAIPVFTQKNEPSGTDETVAKQISELQVAVTHSAQSIKALATQLEQAIKDIDSDTTKIEKDIETAKRLSIAAIAISAVAIILSVVALLR